MGSNTDFLGLLMKDPVADKADTFNIEAMLNENWRKIDAAFPVLRGLIEARANIACGTVTGDDGALEDNPNSITFPFEPKLVLVTGKTQDLRPSSYLGYAYFIWQEGLTQQMISTTNYKTIYRQFRRDGNTLCWWTTDSNSPSALVGDYVAFG